MPQILLALLLYPGLALAVTLALLFGWLAHGRAAFGRVRLVAFWRSADGLAAVMSMLLAALVLALLPWPLHPAPGLPGIASPAALWAATEAAFLIALLPGSLAPTAIGARAASREGQL